MALYDYSRGALFLDGDCQQEWNGGTVDMGGTWRPIDTMAAGGSRRGFVRDEPLYMNVNWTIEIREDGTEYQDICDAWYDGSTVAVHIWIGGVQWGAEGKVALGAKDLKEGTMEVNFNGAKPEKFD